MKIKLTIKQCLLLATTISLISCSEKSSKESSLSPGPSIQELRQDAIAVAKSEFNVGDKMNFMRMNNNAILEDFTITKVEGSNILITIDAEPSTSPYWVNTDSAALFRSSDLVVRRDSKPKNNTQESHEDPTISVTSPKEIADHLQQIKLALPSGKKWNELGLLEKRNWVRVLNNKIPEFYYPASIKVSDIVDVYIRYSVSGNTSILNAGTAEFEIHPELSKQRISLSSDNAKRPSINYDDYDTFKDVRKGDTLKYELTVTVSFDLNEGETDLIISVGTAYSVNNLRK